MARLDEIATGRSTLAHWASHVGVDPLSSTSLCAVDAGDAPAAFDVRLRRGFVLGGFHRQAFNGVPWLGVELLARGDKHAERGRSPRGVDAGGGT